mmetsp:Transcript_11672/g.40876  ORF Transcript_11672/g.40876 Transcript_11672/m.40876 type:complete len:92 (-) Transcript_11672:8-283(-)
MPYARVAACTARDTLASDGALSSGAVRAGAAGATLGADENDSDTPVADPRGEGRSVDDASAALATAVRAKLANPSPGLAPPPTAAPRPLPP